MFNGIQQFNQPVSQHVSFKSNNQPPQALKELFNNLGTFAALIENLRLGVEQPQQDTVNFKTKTPPKQNDDDIIDAEILEEGSSDPRIPVINIDLKGVKQPPQSNKASTSPPMSDDQLEFEFFKLENTQPGAKTSGSTQPTSCFTTPPSEPSHFETVEEVNADIRRLINEIDDLTSGI